MNSRAVRARVADVYGIDADVVPPPVDIDVDAPRRAPAGLGAGLRPVRVPPAALQERGRRGGGVRAPAPTCAWWWSAPAPWPEELAAGRRPATSPCRAGWTTTNCAGSTGRASALVAASYEDFGLTPVEAAAFGRPTAALRWGGFLDTIVEGTTGCFFDEPTPEADRRRRPGAGGGSWSARSA